MNNLSDEQIKELWHNTPTQGDPSGMKFAIVFARAILALSAQQAGTVEPFGYWHEGPTEDESEFYLAKDVPDSDQSCDRCKPLYLAAAPASQGAPKQHFCEKPVVWTDNQMIAFAGFSLYSVSLQHLSIAERLEHFRNRASEIAHTGSRAGG